MAFNFNSDEERQLEEIFQGRIAALDGKAYAAITGNGDYPTKYEVAEQEMLENIVEDLRYGASLSEAVHSMEEYIHDGRYPQKWIEKFFAGLYRVQRDCFSPMKKKDEK